MDIPDGDLVRLARAARLCPQPDDADDAVQDAFLQAFIALDRLRDPDRFAGWLGGIVANVCRAQHRRAPLTLLGDWPENLHPASGGNLPSAEDLDRADVLGRAVAGLPPGQRHAVAAFYYADQPAGQAAATPGAAKARLHKARRRYGENARCQECAVFPALRGLRVTLAGHTTPRRRAVRGAHLDHHRAKTASAARPRTRHRGSRPNWAGAWQSGTPAGRRVTPARSPPAPPLSVI